MKVFYAIIRGIINSVLWLVSHIVFRLKVKGRKNVPKKGGYILCANHISNWDAVVLEVTCPRNVGFMAKKELFKNKFFIFLGNAYGHFPVDRGAKDIEAIKTSMKMLKEEKVLGIFPEGTRNGMARGLKVHTGVARIAMKTGAKIIPVGIKGPFKPFHKVTINYGEPIDISEFKTKDKELEKENTEKATQFIMDKIMELAK